MLKRIIIIGLLLAVFVFIAAAEETLERWAFRADLTTIYTLSNAVSTGENHQRIDTDTLTAGAFFNNPVTGTRKNGFYTAANLHATFRPFSWMEGYFKIYAVHRPGSFYLPLQMENMSSQDLSMSLDAVFGRANVFDALGFNLPVDLWLKAGKFKSQASQFGIISKFQTEQVLFMMNTKTDFTYELTVGLKSPNVSFSAATNYLFHESVQRFYDEDGAVKHGNIVLNEYAPQFLLALRLEDFMNISAELLYGQNVSGIYSGHAAGASARYTLKLSENFEIPIGLGFAFHEKNIDLMGQAAIAIPLAWAGANITTMDFRESIGAALSTGFHFDNDDFKVEVNLAGSYYNIAHYYRHDLSVIKASFDAMFTYANKYFIGGGLILGSVTDALWETRPENIGDDNFHRIFKLEENMGYEVYAGINLGDSSKFVVGFNNNKGIAINNMLEARHEGQMKYKQQGTNWAQDQLAETGGLYFKFSFRF
jgi:hypothetical protein